MNQTTTTSCSCVTVLTKVDACWFGYSGARTSGSRIRSRKRGNAPASTALLRCRPSLHSCHRAIAASRFRSNAPATPVTQAMMIEMRDARIEMWKGMPCHIIHAPCARVFTKGPIAPAPTSASTWLGGPEPRFPSTHAISTRSRR